MASAVASSLMGVSTNVLPKYLTMNVTPSDGRCGSHSLLLARAHSSQSSATHTHAKLITSNFTTSLSNSLDRYERQKRAILCHIY